jgi:hypothetical protein
LESDLLRFWNIDLPRDLGTKRLTWRRLRVLIQNLPQDSATQVEIHGHQAMWDVTDYLLANVVDLLAGANWQRSGKGQRPKPFPRPKSLADARRQRREMERMARKHAEWRAKNSGVNGG